MVRTRHPALALFVAACALPAAAAIPQLSGVTFSQEKAPLVKVSYTLSDAPAVITFDFLTNGVSVGAQFLTNAVGAVNRYVPVGTHTIEWDPVAAGLPETIKASKTAGRAVVTAWPKDAPPDYMVVDLRPGVTDRVAYYASADAVPLTVTNIQYKTDKLVLRRIHAAYKTSRLGAATSSREVMLTKDFYMGIFSFTIGQYWRVKGGTEPSDADKPIVKTSGGTYSNYRGGSWPEEVAVGSSSVAKALNDLVGAETAFDLPTEAQWEFAARCDKDSIWPFASESGGTAKYFGSLYLTYAWNKNNANGVDQEVGLKLPTEWGLYDLFGSNYQWCRDYYNANTASLLALGTSVVDPPGIGIAAAGKSSGQEFRVYRTTSSCSRDVQGNCTDRGGNRYGLNYGGRFVCEARAFGGDVSAEEDAASLAPNRVVIVTYDLPEDKIVTFTASENGVELPPEALTRTWGDINKLVDAGNGRSFALYPDEDYLGRVVNAADVTVELTFWEKSSPPDYMVVNACVTNCVHYYASTNWLPGGLLNANRYRISDVVFRRIPAKGVVWRMGSDATTDGSYRVAANETPHYVKLTNDFYMAVFPMNDYQASMISKGESYTGGLVGSWKIPYDTAQTQAEKLAATSGLPVSLPTEAQWEFAARAGGGEMFGAAGSTTSALAAMAHCNVTGSDGKRGVVGKLKPSAWGLYDIFGSVDEWCLDWFSSGDDFANGWNTPGWETGVPVVDPRGPASGTKRVGRGGFYNSGISACRCAARAAHTPTGTSNANDAMYCGTRLAVIIPN